MSDWIDFWRVNCIKLYWMWPVFVWDSGENYTFQISDWLPDWLIKLIVRNNLSSNFNFKLLAANFCKKKENTGVEKNGKFNFKTLKSNESGKKISLGRRRWRNYAGKIGSHDFPSKKQNSNSCIVKATLWAQPRALFVYWI